MPFMLQRYLREEETTNFWTKLARPRHTPETELKTHAQNKGLKPLNTMIDRMNSLRMSVMGRRG